MIEHTRISQEFWDRSFVPVAHVCYYLNEEADLFDVFDTIRTKIMSGRKYSDEHLEELDKEIAEEDGLS